MIIRQSILTGVPVSYEMMEFVREHLVTPSEIKRRTHFEFPKVIHPKTYANFNSLLINRQAIRDLELLPVKTDQDRASYNAMDRDVLLADLRDLMGNETMFLAPNSYPYHLPGDVDQNIIWVADAGAHVNEGYFMAQIMTAFEIDLMDVIAFERSRETTSKLVKGSFNRMRHAHFWVRKGSL